MLDHPLQDLDAWLLYFSERELPVLRHTVRQIDDAREHLDAVSGRDIAQIVLRDPLMAVRVLAYIQPFRGRHLHHDITTIAGAIMMLGIEPFFKRFDHLASVEDDLKGESPLALLGALQVIRRAQRAAHYAHEWAMWRHDINVEEVTLAALLHDLSEMLLWTAAPKLALQTHEIQKAHPGTRSVAAQEQVLGMRLFDLQTALCGCWHLPELLVTLIGGLQPEHPRVRNVRLAVDLARHSANGWNDPALPDDYAAIANLLNLSIEATMQKLGQQPPTVTDVPGA
jgi:HD-like signal output (HDOD) protein